MEKKTSNFDIPLENFLITRFIAIKSDSFRIKRVIQYCSSPR